MARAGWQRNVDVGAKSVAGTTFFRATVSWWEAAILVERNRQRVPALIIDTLPIPCRARAASMAIGVLHSRQKPMGILGKQ